MKIVERGPHHQKKLKTRKKNFEMYLMRGIALLNCNKKKNYLSYVTTCILNTFALDYGVLLSSRPWQSNENQIIYYTKMVKAHLGVQKICICVFCLMSGGSVCYEMLA